MADDTVRTRKTRENCIHSFDGHNVQNRSNIYASASFNVCDKKMQK